MSVPSWLRPLAARLPGTTPRRRPARAVTTTRSCPSLQTLEDRTVPATFTVTNTNDGGPASLRQAVLDATATPGKDSIVFALPAGDPSHLYYRDDGVAGQVSRCFATATTAADDAAIADIDPDYPHSWWSISVASPMVVDDPVVIDGYAQPGARANTLAQGDDTVLRVELVGDRLPGSRALWFQDHSNDSTVRGLVVNGFNLGLDFRGGPGAVVEGNFIGTDVSGTVVQGNDTGVIVLSGDANVRIGGATPAARNVISGNDRSGIHEGFGTVLIQGNFIGTDRTGTRALGNGNGVFLQDVAVVGGTTPGARNIISGNNLNGIEAAVANAWVAGNYIGTDVTGTRAVGNSTGVLGGRMIGGTDPAARNVISGNGYGIVGGGTVQGNYIGTDYTGQAPLGNAVGAFLQWNGTLLGGTVSGAANVIAGNNQGGVLIGGIDNRVEGNFIGVGPGPDGTPGTADDQPLGNREGVAISYSAANNTIGGTAPGTGNVITWNGVGVYVLGSASGNRVQGNLITFNFSGVTLSDAAADNLVGGTEPGGGNIIAHNGDGVLMAFHFGSGLLVPPLRNAILGNSTFANADKGIDLRDGSNNRQNYPVLTSAITFAGGITIMGTLNSVPNSTFRIEFFANPAPDPSGYGEGQTYLRFATVTTNASGDAAFSVTLADPLPAG